MSDEELSTAIPQEVHDSDETSFGVVPAGEYPASVKSVKVVRTKDGQGSRLKIQWTITEKAVGRVVFDDLNINLPGKPEATKIGLGQIKNRLNALGIGDATDFAEMIGRDALIKVRVKTDDYGEKNEVQSARAIGAAATTPGARAAPAAEAPRRTKPKFA